MAFPSACGHARTRSMTTRGTVHREIFPTIIVGFSLKQIVSIVREYSIDYAGKKAYILR
jgi:hypothetical protein